MGSAEQRGKPFPPHRVIGDIYYVGTEKLSSFLIVTGMGNILINTTEERNVRGIEKSIAALGFRFADVKLILGTQASVEQRGGDALAKQDSGGAIVEVMREDVPTLQGIEPAGKPHPIDKILRDGDSVTLGGTFLTARLTAGRTPGCTTFTLDQVDNGKSYHVVIGCSLRAPPVLTPALEAEFTRSFQVMHALPCDVLLGDHPAQFALEEKYAMRKPGVPNPYIDARSCRQELDIEEAMFWAVHKEQAPPFDYSMPDHPVVVFDGEAWTPNRILDRNMGTFEEQSTQFPPHHIIGNIYYVGTKSISSFLIVTPKGHILLDTLEQEYVPVIEKSVADLGFKFSDIKIILGNHAHSDHMAGNALVKQLTGGEIDVMEGDVAAMQCKPYCYSDPTRTPDGRPHPIDRVLHDGDEISLGGTTLVAHLTAGHTDGCTTFTTTVVEAGKPYHVVFACSLRSPATITPRIAYEFGRTFQVVRDLPCDVYLGDHPSFYDMHTKYAKLKPGAPNPFIDAETCHREIDFEEASFNAILAEQEEDPPVVQP